MSDNALNEINAELETLVNTRRASNKEVFDLGVKLGRLLERKEIADYECKFWIDSKNKDELFKIRSEALKSLHNVFLILIKAAIKEQINEVGNWVVIKSSESINYSKLTDAIVDKYGIQFKSCYVDTKEDLADFEVEFTTEGKMKLIFENFNLPVVIKASIERLNGGEETEFETADDVNFIRTAGSDISYRDTEITKEKIDAIINDISKLHFFLFLKM
jgi:hypothetical protein